MGEGDENGPSFSGGSRSFLFSVSSRGPGRAECDSSTHREARVLGPGDKKQKGKQNATKK